MSERKELDPADKAHLLAARQETIEAVCELGRLLGEDETTAALFRQIGTLTVWLETCSGKMPERNRLLVNDGVEAVRELRERIGAAKSGRRL